MTPDTVAAVAALAPSAASHEALQSAAAAAPGAPAGFGTHVLRELEQLNHGLLQSDQMVARYAAGEPVSLHAVMIHMEETRLAFQTLVQVRNKVLEAYQDVMRMQV
jgi:flagellar hook-basal body complex protein FliE